MNNEFEVSFIHTEPCSVCKGLHVEYRTRQCCRNCDSLYDVMIKRGLLILPRTCAKGSKVVPDIAKRISSMKAAGASISDMAKATGLSTAISPMLTLLKNSIKTTSKRHLPQPVSISKLQCPNISIFQTRLTK